MPATRLFDEQDRRLFFNLEERTAFLKAANRADGATRTFCHLLHYTGCTVPDALDLTPLQIDVPGRAVILGSATSRRHDMTRSVPVPGAFIALLDAVHDISRTQQAGLHDHGPIWPVSRNTTYDRVGRVIREIGIRGAPHATPKGIRYGFLVHAIRCGVILSRAEKWMGYSYPGDLAHYVEQLARLAPDEVGNERDDASLMW
jgi:integrase/recombinase XerD